MISFNFDLQRFGAKIVKSGAAASLFLNDGTAVTISGAITFTGSVNGLPKATASALGVVKPGTGMQITSDGVLNCTLNPDVLLSSTPSTVPGAMWIV